MVAGLTCGSVPQPIEGGMVTRNLPTNAAGPPDLLDLDFPLELRFNFLLRFVLSDTVFASRVLHAFLITLLSVVGHQLWKPLGLGFPCDQLLDKSDIYADPISYTAGANLMGVKLSNNMDLLFPGVLTIPGVSKGWRWRAGVLLSIGLLHKGVLAVVCRNANCRFIEGRYINYQKLTLWPEMTAYSG